MGVLAVVALAVALGGLGVVVFSRFPKAYSLGLVILACFGLQVLGDGGTGEVTSGLALVTSRLLAGQNPWAPLTYMFAHADLAHLFGNLFILLTVGPILEDRVGSRRFLAIYLAAGLGAAVAHVALTLTGVVSSIHAPALGASGAIFGVLTAFAVRYPRETIPIPMFFIIWLPAFIVLLVYLLMNVAFMFRATNVAWWGHFAGFLVGLAYAAALDKRAPGGTGAHALHARGPPPAVDVEALRPLARSRRDEEILARLKQFSAEASTAHDREFQDAWLDRFFGQARCPVCEGRLTRAGLTAVCERADYKLDFARKRGTPERAP